MDRMVGVAGQQAQSLTMATMPPPRPVRRIEELLGQLGDLHKQTSEITIVAAMNADRLLGPQLVNEAPPPSALKDPKPLAELEQLSASVEQLRQQLNKLHDTVLRFDQL